MTADRMSIIQDLIDKKHAGVYLEIGVHEGECFLRIKARRKIAVDPNLLITPAKKRKFIFRNFRNVFNRYCAMTSDDFFSTHQAFLARYGLDVVFIDGLHTYRQSLKDVLNSLRYLNDDGIIVMHDCNPISEAAAYPADSCEHAKSLAIPGFTGEWNGDVWKTIVHLRAKRPDLKVFVIDCDQGLGVITKEGPGEPLTVSAHEIDTLTYQDLDSSRSNLLNLKGLEFFRDYLNAR